jgi:phosphoribosylglycinamide formyltransferase-1
MNNLKIAVLLSGAGSTLRNLIQWKQCGELPVDFELVISSCPTAGGVAIAQEAAIPVEIVARKNFSDSQLHSQRVFGLCREHGVQLVVMAGYLEHLAIAPDFEQRVVNIHPGLIPAFCGRGFYGLRVHEAALEYGVKLSGCTVHFVDNQYDHGPIIAQRACPVFEVDTPESLQGRVGELERQLYPEVIAAIARDQVSVSGRRVALRAIV